jgi:peptidoglycan/xylan/chitin deacetylase (PgdA/CDA1 family)
LPDGTTVGYVGHTVGEGETLEQIAAATGSSADLIADYNALDGEPLPGRPLIVPQITSPTVPVESRLINVRRGSSRQPWVALTLDAGASAAPTLRMLDALSERNIKITFFLTGKWVRENPELTRRIVADGHEIANHTFTHPDLTRVGDERIRQELADTEAVLQVTAPGARIRPFFRPPYGAFDERVLEVVQGEGYLSIYWTLDSLDSVGEPKTPEFLVERVTGALTPEQLRGAIILAHCGSEATADALPQILDRFAAMGFEVCKLSEVLNG